MYKKFAISLITIFLLSSGVFAASDGELKLSVDDQPKKIKDCFEKLNKITFSFNQGLDKVIIKPVASVYRLMPSPVKTGVLFSINALTASL